MNLDKILFTTILMSITVIAAGQEKGYYSIGNNEVRLKVTAEAKSPDSFFKAEKGYYAMEINRRKLKRSLHKGPRSDAHEVKKGYYSIGNNAHQLKKSGD